MLGAFWASRLGLLDLARVTGRGDGLAVVLGFLAGVGGAASILPLLQSFYLSTPRGTLLLPDLLGVSYGVVVLAVVVIAGAGFAVAERIEVQVARRRA